MKIRKIFIFSTYLLGGRTTKEDFYVIKSSLLNLIPFIRNTRRILPGQSKCFTFFKRTIIPETRAQPNHFENLFLEFCIWFCDQV